MSNIDKRALREAAEKAPPGPWRYLKSTPFMDAEISAKNNTRVVNLLNGDVTADNSEFIAAASPATVLELLDELDAAEKRIAELQIARDKCFLSGLKTGWEYGIADDTEGYNREIADAQAVIDRAAGIGVKGE